MYCSACGVAVAQNLTYCNYCGAKLSGAADGDSDPSELKPGLLVSAMVGLFVLGLVAITMLMGVMKVMLRLDTEVILVFSGLCFLIMLSLEGMFARLLFRRKRGSGAAGETMIGNWQATKELDAAQARPMPETARSVTEHTTRTLEPVHNERTPK